MISKPNLVKLTPGEEYKQSVIQTLEEALRRAKAGEISSAAVSMVKVGGGTTSMWSKSRDPATLLGAIHLTGIDLGTDLLKDSIFSSLPDPPQPPLEVPDNVA